MSRREKKLDKVRLKLDQCFKDGQYYEAQQLYRGLYNRLLSKDKFEEAANLLQSGALLLLQHKQGNSGGDLALQLVDCYCKSKERVTPQKLETIRTIFSSFPPSTDDSKITFMKAAISYSSQYGSSSQGEPLLHKDFALFYQSRQEYNLSQRHYLRSDSYRDHAKMLLEWATKGFLSEFDLFIARAVLQYLCLENLAGANELLEIVTQQIQSQNQSMLASRLESESVVLTDTSLNTPLMHFIQFLLKTVERDAAPLFEMLRQKYAASLERDPAFHTYMNKIGELYFGLKAPQGMLANLFDLVSNK